MSQADVEALVHELNANPEVHGILVQVRPAAAAATAARWDMREGDDAAAAAAVGR